MGPAQSTEWPTPASLSELAKVGYLSSAVSRMPGNKSVGAVSTRKVSGLGSTISSSWWRDIHPCQVFTFAAYWPT
jgi:hypothetical protein